MFNDYINTPIEENKYNLKWIKPNDFKNYKYYKNIIILSLEHPSDSTIDILYKKFKNQYNNLDLFSLVNYLKYSIKSNYIHPFPKLKHAALLNI